MNSQSGAVSGNRGCALLLSSELPYATFKGTDLYFKQSQLVRLQSMPRILFVRIESPLFRHVIAVAHAPYQKSKQLDGWWDDFRTSCDKWQPDLLFIDANGKLSNDEGLDSDWLGQLGPDQVTDGNGQQLH